MSKTSLFVRMKTHAGKRDEALAALMAALPSAEAEEGTEIYSFHVDKADPDVLWVFELYSDDAVVCVDLFESNARYQRCGFRRVRRCGVVERVTVGGRDG